MSDKELIWEGRALETTGSISRVMHEIYLIEDVEERQKTADKFMALYRAYSEHADSNIGYLTGYEGPDTMVDMLRLFGVEHPVFGGPEAAAQVTPTQAFELGMKLGEEMKEEEDLGS